MVRVVWVFNILEGSLAELSTSYFWSIRINKEIGRFV